MTALETLHKKWLKEPRYRAAYDALTPEFELAKALIDLLPQVNKRIQMGQAARDRIEKHFSLEQMVTKTAEVYTELVTKNNE